MRELTIEQTDLWTVTMYGGGVAFSFRRKSDGAEASVQGDDADAWERDYWDMCSAYRNPGSVWHLQTWDACLTELCGDIVAVQNPD